MNDIKKHRYAMGKASQNKYNFGKYAEKITGFYLYNESKLEYKPLLKPIKGHKMISSIRLPYSPNKMEMWVNHTDFNVVECSFTKDVLTKEIEFSYNGENYIMTHCRNNEFELIKQG